jgi:hypothetical protein
VILSCILGRKGTGPPKRLLDRPPGPVTLAILLRTARKLAVPTMLADALSASSLTFFEYLTARNAVPKATNGNAMKGKIMLPRGAVVVNPRLVVVTSWGSAFGNRKNRAAASRKKGKALSAIPVRNVFLALREKNSSDAKIGLHSSASSLSFIAAGRIICVLANMHSSKGISTNLFLPLGITEVQETTLGL